MTEEAVASFTVEEELQRALIVRFGFLDGKIRIARPRRIFAVVDQANFNAVLTFAIESLNFTILCTITGLDNGTTLGFIYHLSRQDGITLNVQFDVPKDNPVIQTITRYFSYAEIYERELVDLLGAKVDGLSEGKRYPLPDDWPAGQYPLRKDWKKPAKPEENKNA